MENNIKFLQPKDLTIGNSYYVLLDECMGGYPEGVLKVKLIENKEETQVINRYVRWEGYKDLSLPVFTSNFQVEEILEDFDNNYNGKETITFKDINNENENLMSYIDSTPENLTWIKENPIEL